jgi:hypothetical protein
MATDMGNLGGRERGAMGVQGGGVGLQPLSACNPRLTRKSNVTHLSLTLPYYTFLYYTIFFKGIQIVLLYFY